jgi:hypothetical protein
MNNPPLLILIAIIIGLSILTINISINFVMARPPVIQEEVNTGNPNLDKQINEFYHCISKTHEDPPSIQTVDNCYSQNSVGHYQGPDGYYQNSIGGISGGGNSNNSHDSNGGTHSTASARPPPGVLVEVANSNNSHDSNGETHSTRPPPGVLVEVA